MENTHFPEDEELPSTEPLNLFSDEGIENFLSAGAAEATSQEPQAPVIEPPAESPAEAEPTLHRPFDLSILDDPDLMDSPESVQTEPVVDEEITLLLKENDQEFDDHMQKPEVQESVPVRDHPPAKGRPKNKRGEGFFGIPNILVSLVWIALTVLIGVTIGRMIWICASDVLAFGREDRSVSVTIYESDTIEDITRKLHNADLIKYPGLFKLYASFAVDEGEIHPGMWDLNTRYDYHALVKMMSPSSTREVIKVMIPEGYSCRQIFALLEENKVCTVQDISAYAANGELADYWFLENVERGDPYCLEGFLFPDTYEFYKNDSPKNILTKLLNNFDYRFDEEMRWQIDQLNAHLTDLMRRGGKNDKFIAEHLFTVREVVIVASMIERETASHKESPIIASVIYNRLFDWGNNPPYLNIDATIVYALNGKNDLTAEDLQVDSPYNTYTHTGLTPGPIANPGVACMKAALTPEDTNYYFYVLDPVAGAHHFSRTQEEHNAFRATLGG